MKRDEEKRYREVFAKKRVGQGVIEHRESIEKIMRGQQGEQSQGLSIQIASTEDQLLQLLKTLSQCFAILQRLMQCKLNKLHSNLKILYVIL